VSDCMMILVATMQDHNDRQAATAPISRRQVNEVLSVPRARIVSLAKHVFDVARVTMFTVYGPIPGFRRAFQ